MTLPLTLSLVGGLSRDKIALANFTFTYGTAWVFVGLLGSKLSVAAGVRHSFDHLLQATGAIRRAHGGLADRPAASSDSASICRRVGRPPARPASSARDAGKPLAEPLEVCRLVRTRTFRPPPADLTDAAASDRTTS